ncbi:hypothetical protein [Gaiella sp.]|uniref:hypothetical protein n=1 Tax=Gaiella sp. TaxID=2663207 RepID=UPI0039839C82
MNETAIPAPEGARDSSRRILVLSTVENAGDKLGQHTGPDDTIKVVVPAVRQGFLDWLANDQEAFAHAEEVAAETAAALPGHAVSSSAGEADVALAIRDALATFAADEIIVAVRSDDDAGIVEQMATKDAPHRSVEGVPIRFIIVNES